MGKGRGIAETKGSGQRELRRDAAANRDRVLAAAAAAIRRQGTGVPIATIAADAGVGVATLYRRYPTREDLLAALTLRSFRLVLNAAQSAATSTDSGIDALRRFIEQTIEHGPEFVLPMHGGPIPLNEDAVGLRSEVHATIEGVLRRGRHDGTIRADVTAFDIIVFGALLAQPLPHVSDWRSAARRQAKIYFDGLASKQEAPLSGPGL
jgi:AcrR family transcriptional regulator